MAQLNRWQGRTALVTGASSGIGSTVARRLVATGLTVYAAARRLDRLAALAAAAGPKLIPLELDVRDDRSITSAFSRLKTERGGLDVLVNNAGVGYGEPLLSGRTELWREMLEVNVLGLCVCTREGAALMSGRSEGHIFHLGSLSGHRIPKGSNMYGATKFAVRSLTESLRVELHEQKLPIRITCISPGYVESEFHARYYADEQKAQELYASTKVLESEDIADAICYALGAPAHVQIHDLLLRSTSQAS